MMQYNLTNNYLDILVADASLHKMWRQQSLFDAIITDRKLISFKRSTIVEKLCLNVMS